MYILPISTNKYPVFEASPLKINGRNYIPLSENTKPLLDLAENDKTKISKLQEKIEQVQNYVAKKCKQVSYKDCSMSTRRSVNRFIEANEKSVMELKEQIRKIKIKRYKQQLEEFANQS